jgi:hypothetical protein
MDQNRAGAERVDANYHNARALVHSFPDKAVELIALNCEYDLIRQYIAIASHSREGKPHQPVRNIPNEYSALEPPFPTTSSTSSQHSTSPTSPLNNTRFSRSRGNTNVLPPSPAPTSSTRKSSARPEYIIVIVNGPTPECKLSMRNVSTEHSVIREDIVQKRLDDSAHVEEIPNGPIKMPYHGVPGGVLTSYCQATLTWRRNSSTSFKTHETTFYMVQDDIDSDILLGEADSGQTNHFNTGSCFSITLRAHAKLIFVF